MMLRLSTAWDRRLEPLQDIPRQAGVFLCQVIIIVIMKSHPPRHENHLHDYHQNHDDQADQVTVHCLVCLKALSPHLAFPGEDDDGHYGEDDDEHDGDEHDDDDGDGHDGDDGDDFAP